jgi:hypothetical protein
MASKRALWTHWIRFLAQTQAIIMYFVVVPNIYSHIYLKHVKVCVISLIYLILCFLLR